MRPPKNDWKRQPRTSGFDDDRFYGSASTPPPPPSFAGFGGGGPELSATVKWFNPEKGFGFVELADGTGDVFLHINALQSSGHTTVSPGAKMQVRVGQGQKGRQVEMVLTVDESTAESPRARSASPSGAGGYGAGAPRSGGMGGGMGGARPARAQVDMSSAVDMMGTVKWYNPTKGFGFISPQDGGKDVFVHATALERAGLQPLQDGQSVRMAVVQGTKGPEVGTISLG